MSTQDTALSAYTRTFNKTQLQLPPHC